MTKSNRNRPSLAATVASVHQLLRPDSLQQSPAQVAELYQQAIRLLGALKDDQALLRRCRCVERFSYSKRLDRKFVTGRRAFPKQ